MAVAMVATEATEIGRKKWTDDETLTVAKRYCPLRIVNPHADMMDLLQTAQKCLSRDRHKAFVERKTAYFASKRLTEFWTKWSQDNPKDAEKIVKSINKTLEIEEVTQVVQQIAETKPPEPIKPVEATLPAPLPPPPVAPVLGPLETALSAMVERAVERALDTQLHKFTLLLQAHQDYMQGLVNAQHDSLRGYFDPDFQRAHEILGEYIGDINQTIHKTALEEVRLRRKRVLVVATNNPKGMQNHLESKFSGIEFVFVDGSASNKVQAGGFYDLVLCNATNKPNVKHKLAELRGVKVAYTDGGSSSMVEIIRQRLGI